MSHNKLAITSLLAVLSLIILALVSTTMAADSVEVQGTIKARNGTSLILQVQNSPDVTVVLSDDTKVGQVQGVLKARRKDISMAALIPGLAIKVKGTYDSQHQLLATEISFKGNDLKTAESMQAGLHESKEKLAAAEQQLSTHQREIAANKEKIAANKAAIDAAIARFGQLDDYYIFDEVTVYFGNGQVKVDPQYVSQLVALAERAKSINGYMIEVKGYASSSGSAAINQKLSEDRAANVTHILIQRGKVSLTRMLAPGAMGESEQVSSTGSKKEKEIEAENRRVVVRVLQNKAIAGV